MDVSRLEQPAEVIRAAAAWVADRIAGQGFVWRPSRAKLERRDGRRREQIYLQNSQWNRTGEVIAFDVTVNVRDARVRAWRRAHPDQTSDTSGSDYVCGHALVMLTSMDRAQVDLTDPESRLERLDAFVGILHEVVMPWFARTRDPRRLPAELDDETLRSQPVELAEWLVSLGERERARQLIQRWLELEPAAHERVRAGAEAARASGRPLSGDQWADVGWSRVLLELD